MGLDEFISSKKEALEQDIKNYVTDLLKFDDLKVEVSQNFDDFSIAGVVKGLKGVAADVKEKVGGVAKKLGALQGLKLIPEMETSVDLLMTDEGSSQMFDFIDDLNDVIMEVVG